MVKTGQNWVFISQKISKMQMNSNNENATETRKNTSKIFFFTLEKPQGKLNICCFI